MLSFLPPADPASDPGVSPLLGKKGDCSDWEEDLETHSVSTVESGTGRGGDRRNGRKRKEGRNRLREGKGGVVAVKAVKGVPRRPPACPPSPECSDLSTDPCDFLSLSPCMLQCSSVKSKREAVTEIKGRMRAIEESIQQAKAVLRKLISQRQ